MKIFHCYVCDKKDPCILNFKNCAELESPNCCPFKTVNEATPNWIDLRTLKLSKQKVTP